MLDNAIADGSAVASVAWTSPDTGLWVATENGEYAGMVEFREGRFEILDATGSPVGSATSIPAAKSTLLSHLRSEPVQSIALPRIPFLSRAPRTGYRRSSAGAA